MLFTLRSHWNPGLSVPAANVCHNTGLFWNALWSSFLAPGRFASRSVIWCYFCGDILERNLTFWSICRRISIPNKACRKRGNVAIVVPGHHSGSFRDRSPSAVKPLHLHTHTHTYPPVYCAVRRRNANCITLHVLGWFPGPFGWWRGTGDSPSGAWLSSASNKRDTVIMGNGQQSSLDAKLQMLVLWHHSSY